MGLSREILKIPGVKPVLFIIGVIGLYGVYLGNEEASQPKAPTSVETPTPAPAVPRPLNTAVEAKVLAGFKAPDAFIRGGFTWQDTNLLSQYKTENTSVAFIGGNEDQARALARCAAALDLKKITLAEGNALTASYEAGSYSNVAASCEKEYRGNNRAFIVGPGS